MASAVFSLELESAALTRWQGPALTSLCAHDAGLVASDGAHVYRLSGTTDDGAPIPVDLLLPATDGGIPGPKRLRAIRLSGVVGGPLAVTAASESRVGLEGRLRPVGQDGLPGQTTARLGRGHGRSWVLAFSAQDAQPLEIAAIEAEFLPLDRREV